MEESTVELRESTIYTRRNKLEQQREKTWGGGVNRMKNTNSRPPQDSVVFRPIRKLQCIRRIHIQNDHRHLLCTQTYTRASNNMKLQILMRRFYLEIKSDATRAVPTQRGCPHPTSSTRKVLHQSWWQVGKQILVFKGVYTWTAVYSRNYNTGTGGFCFTVVF